MPNKPLTDLKDKDLRIKILNDGLLYIVPGDNDPTPYLEKMLEDAKPLAKSRKINILKIDDWMGHPKRKMVAWLFTAKGKQQAVALVEALDKKPMGIARTFETPKTGIVSGTPRIVKKNK